MSSEVTQVSLSNDKHEMSTPNSEDSEAGWVSRTRGGRSEGVDKGDNWSSVR